MMRAAVVTLLGALLAGPACAPAAPSGHSVSVGWPSRGFIRAAVALPAQGPGYRFVRDPLASYGTARMIAFLQRAAKRVRDEGGAGPPVRIGDISTEGGGRIDGHGSHRSGRDVDLLYFARDASGRLADVGAMRFDRKGRGEGGHKLDTSRNWALVRAMLTDPDVEVQWIFCSHGIKVLLLEEALAQGEDLEIVRRAAWVLHRPTNSRPHDDHMHVRIFCSAEERSLGCLDGAPDWDWRARDGREPYVATDPEILAALEPEPEAAVVRTASDAR